jgi:hypothetical protein
MASCLTHQDRPATVHCAQCHRPICNQCIAIRRGSAAFCSKACDQKWRQFQARYRPPDREGGLLRKLFWLVVLAAIAAAGLYVAHLMGVDAVAPIFRWLGM